MEQCQSSSGSKTESHLRSLFGPKETEVSEILLDLPNLIQREFPCQVHVIWNGKRKRSAIDSSPSKEEWNRGKKKRPQVEVEALSPTTPLSFSRNESDETSKYSLEKSYRKTKREMDELTQRGEVLRGEIEAVKTYYNKLEAINLDLKAKKRELEMSKKFGVDLSLIKSNKVIYQDYYYMLHQQPSNVDQTAYGVQPSEKFQQYPFGKFSPFLSSGSGSGKVKGMGPLCIPSLNVSTLEKSFGVDSSQPLDPRRALVVAVGDHRVKAAEARRRRMSKMKDMKNSYTSIQSLKCR